MKPRRTHFTNQVFRFPGGNEDNDLWTYQLDDRELGMPIICSVWEPSEDERAAIARGENIRLCVWGGGMPPVAIDLTDEPLGKSPDSG